MSSYALQARWILPIDRPPIEGGVISIAGEKISAIGENISGRAPIDLGDAIILPGLVNAHTHLEFSDLSIPLGDSGMSLPDWIRLVVDYRRRKNDRSFHAIAIGLGESVGHGVTTVGEIAIRGTTEAPGWSPIVIQGVAVEVTVFLELIGLGHDRASAGLSAAREHLSREGPNWRPALSPHAPYSTDIQVVAGAADLCARLGTPLAIHLAESREELEFLKSGAGPFRRLLEDLRAWPDGGIAFGSRPLDYMQVLSAAPRSLVIHGNYLSDDEIDYLGRHRDRFAVVYCPRTHHYFRHDPYPLKNLLAAGVIVALGTDSRASNPDLDLLAEMQFVAEAYPDLPKETIIRMGTLNGAWALRRDADIGSLAAGKDANLKILARPIERIVDPYRAVLELDFELEGVIVRGVSEHSTPGFYLPCS